MTKRTPTIKVKHFVFVTNFGNFKVKAHSKDTAFAVFQLEYADVEADDVVIDTVSGALYTTLDYREILEVEEPILPRLVKMDIDFRSIFTKVNRFHLFFNGLSFPHWGFITYKGCANNLDDLIAMVPVNFPESVALQVIDLKRNQLFEIDSDEIEAVTDSELHKYIVEQLNLLQ